MRRLARGIWVLAVAGCDVDLAALRSAAPSSPPPAAGAAPASRSAREIDDCRDQCEQSQIVAGRGSDAQLRACRARCGEPAGAAPVAHEVPSRISVAPATRQSRVYDGRSVRVATTPPR